MNTIVTELEGIKKEVDEVQINISRAEGRYEAAMQVLKEAGFTSIENAEKYYTDTLEGLTARVDTLKASKEDFIKRYNEVFNA